MLIESRNPVAYAFLRFRSLLERDVDIAKYYGLFTLARICREPELVIKRKRQILPALVTKNRQFYWSDSDQITHIEIEPHAMPYYVLKRILRNIPRDEIHGKTILDLFAGHGAVGNAIAMGGLQGDVRPRQVLMIDKAYTESWHSYAIHPKWESQLWKLGYVMFSNWHNLPHVDRGGGRIFKKNPDYSGGDASRLPLRTDSVDTVIADPPFGRLTKIVDPEGLIMRSLGEVHRVLKPGGNAYYLMPRVWTAHMMTEAPMRGTILSRNVGRTWFDISLVRFTK